MRSNAYLNCNFIEAYALTKQCSHTKLRHWSAILDTLFGASLGC